MSHMGQDIQALIRATGSQPRLVRLRGEWWRRGIVPLLVLRLEDGATLLLLPDAAGRYRPSQPGGGVGAVLTAQEAAAVAERAYCLYPRQDAGTTTATGWRELRALTRSSEADLRLALLLGGGLSLLNLTLPLAARALLGVTSTTAYLLTLLVLVLAALLMTAFQMARGLALLRAEVRIGALLQTRLWERLLRLPTPFFRQISPGDLTARLDALTAGRALLVPALLSLTLNGLIVVAALGLLFALDWRAGGLALSGSILAILGGGLLFRRAVPLYRALAARQNALLGLTVGVVGGIAKLRAARAETRAFSFWETAFTGLRRAARRAAGVRRSALALQAGILPSMLMAVFGVAALSGGLSKEELLVATFGASILASALAAMWADSLVAARAIPCFEQLRPILETEPEMTRTGRDPGTLSGGFELSDIHFAYEQSRDLALAGVSMQVAAGSFVAVVGPSGSGKSTLLRLLLGFDSPQQGSVRYDGQCLSELDLYEVRRQIGTVLQHATLVPGTIRSNILGAAPLTEEDAWQAADRAGITPLIQALPMRLNTIITESGGAFSGGERQRLLIARALARHPRILLLDEATSALDQRVQAAVMQSIAQLKLTRFVIAHRISTVRHADCIYVLDQGRIVQQGTYDELLACSGLFQELARRQLLIA